LEISYDVSKIPSVEVPLRVQESVARYHRYARPIATAAHSGVKFSMTRTLALGYQAESQEAVITGFRRVIGQNSAFSARGRTSAAAVRGFVYDCLAEASDVKALRALWMVRYASETVMALGLTHLLDTTTTRHIAARMSGVTDDMRMRLGVEAGRRGSTLDEWWDDMAAALPTDLARMSEGSASWALAAAHMLLHPPTDKWQKLTRAMAYSSHTVLAQTHLRTIRLPAKIGSLERSLEAGAATARRLGMSYGAYYTAMHDVANVFAARMERAGNKMGAAKVRLAGMMWDIRAKIASSVVLRIDDGTSVSAGYFTGKHGRYHITTVPYAAYQRWHTALNSAGCVKKDVKATFPHHAPAILSEAFSGKETPLYTVSSGAQSRLYRYAVNPSKLGQDIERTLSEMLADIRSVVQYYDAEEDTIPDMSDSPTSGIVASFDFDPSRYKPAAGSYWDVIGQLEPMDAADLVDAVTRMDSALAAEIESAEYESGEALLQAVWAVESDAAEQLAERRDAII